MSGDPPSHELLRLLAQRRDAGSRPGRRTDGLRIALAIEGGGMRGTVSGGMALALHELGLVPAFDAVYGASAGAISGAWLVSSRPEGLRGWAEPSYAKTLIRWSAMLRGKPVVDVRTLIEVVYQTQWPMDFASVLASQVEYHPLATDAVTGASADLRPLISEPADLRLALRASASLPFLAGQPVQLGGRRFYDAGLAESIPFRTPLDQGATHILVLRSRRALAHSRDTDSRDTDSRDTDSRDTDETGAAPSAGATPSATPSASASAGSYGKDSDGAPGGPPAAGRVNGRRAPRPPRSVRLLARTTLRRESMELRTALLTRGARTAADVVRIAEHSVAGRAFSIKPPRGSPPVSRLTTDGAMLGAAFEAGREAVLEVFS